MRLDRCLAGVTVVVLTACTASSTAPTPNTGVPPTASGPATPSGLTVSGVVAEGAQPIEGAQIDNGYGPGSWVFSDANGAFQLPTNKSINPHAWVRASKSGYLQPCAAPITTTGPVAVQLVSLAMLTSVPLPSPSGFRTISGVVVIATSAGTQPAAGAWVDFEPSPTDDWPAAITHADVNGKFSLCTLPETTVIVGAVVGNIVASTAVPPGETHIELTVEPPDADGTNR
jgi:hypothetical protein